MFSFNAYFHPKGTVNQKSSIYEVESHGVYEIVAVKNGEKIEEFILKVLDETKPVFLVMLSIDKKQMIWKIDSHMNRTCIPGRVSIKDVKGSEFGVIFLQMTNPQTRENWIKIIKDDQHYYAGIPDSHEYERCIYYLDLLDFVSCDISWDTLLGRSYLLDRKRLKERSFQEKFLEYQRKTKEFAGRLLANDDNLRACYRNIAAMKEELNVLRQEADEAKKKLAKIPKWLKFFFNVA